MNLLDICKIGGVSVKKFDGEKKYIATGDIIDNKITSYEIVDYNSKPSRANVEIKSNDILFAKMIDTVKVLKTDDNNVNNIYSTGFYCITPNANVLQDYLYYYFNSDSFNSQKNKNCSGATQKAINNEGLKKIKIKFLPNIEEQNIVVQKLYNLDNLIAIKKEEINKLDLLIKSQFVEMFGDPITNDKEYPLVDFINVVKLQRGYDLPNQDRDNMGDIPVYGANGILDKHTGSKCLKGIITGRSGTIGKVYYSFEEFWPLNTTLFSIETYGNNIIYLKYLLDMFELKRFVDATGVPTLNRNVVHKQKIIKAPIELQNKFAQIVEQIDKQKFVNEKILQNIGKFGKIC